MIEIKLFIYLLGIVAFVEGILDKYNLYYWIQKHGANSESEFIYKLSSCRFCIRVHLTWIMYILAFYMWDSNLNDCIITIISVSGVLSLINKNK